ncbi:uncharacterized protein I206_106056 [Kwoniella pini CBS 10737]|uniref:Asl1-like glycosyl hydrolase catalytic domain-containing protein n=1 Tax=Kwoniella pini CBS 10737 TaxID=1296096 RepID=A0A1B9I165_9TREE|nr:uncharacterized protein I206_04879 [Kwoniella pini CBS 10737]OCF49191.1 hypothetical protein I206_04879 [Kwoniella pini CBS 10737]
MKFSILITILPLLALSSAAPAPAVQSSSSSSVAKSGSSTSSASRSSSSSISKSTSSIKPTSSTSIKLSVSSSSSKAASSTSKISSSSSIPKSPSSSISKPISSVTSAIKTSTSSSKVSTTTSKASSTSTKASASTTKASSTSSKSSMVTSTSKAITSSISKSISASTSKISSTTSKTISTTTSSSAQTTSSSAQTTSSSAGLGLSWQSYQKLANTKGLKWYYNWSFWPMSMGDIEYVPMIWGESSINDWDGNVPTGSTYILGFNEPDQPSSAGGSNMNVTQGSLLHQKWTNKLVNKNIKIGSPAVARGGSWWFNGWLQACNGQCKFDFVPIHFYGTNANDLITYIKTFPSQGKPIWLTEVACLDFSSGQKCTLQENKDFMKISINWFESIEGKKFIERWSWFGAFPDVTDPWGLENSNGTLNDLGNYYLTL